MGRILQFFLIDFKSVSSFLKNKYVVFTISRYFGFFIKFLQSIYIAASLGPYYFGLWGFILMLIEYLKYSSIGLEHSVNVELSTLEKKPSNDKKIGEIIFNSLIPIFLVSILMIIGVVIIKLGKYDFGAKYNLLEFLFYIIGFIIVNNFHLILTNVYRSYLKFNKIIFSELLFGLLPFLTIFFFSKEYLLRAIIISMIIARLIGLLAFVINFKFPFSWKLNYSFVKSLIIIGFGLLVYNVSYSLVFLSANSVISVFYSVEEFGFFTLAFSVTSATMLGLKAITYAVYPKVLFNLRDGLIDENIKEYISKMTTIYSLVVCLVVVIMVVVLPILFYFIPEYSPISVSLNWLLLAQAFYAFSFIHSSMIFARKKQSYVVKITLILLAIFIFIYLVIGYNHLDYNLIAMSITTFVVIYSILQINFANKLINNNVTWLEIIISVFRLRMIFPIIFSMAMNYLGLYYLSPLGILIYVLLNIKNIKNAFKEIKILLG